MSGVDLVQWLRDQLDEDERIARQASEYAEAEWHLNDIGDTILCFAPEPRVAENERRAGLRVTADQWRGITIDYSSVVPHIAAHDPARVLREIDAKREIVEQHVPVGDGTVCLSYCHTRTPGEHQPWPCLTLRLLALPYADHPGYRDEWKPRQLYRAGMPGVIDYREEGA